MDFIGLPYYAIPNGAAWLSIPARAILKATGRKSGVPDLHIPVPFGSFHSLYIETKTPTKNSKPSKEQIYWHKKLTELGHRVEVVREVKLFELLMLECYPEYARKMAHLNRIYLKQNTHTQ
jgi:hypothetical protein